MTTSTIKAIANRVIALAFLLPLLSSSLTAQISGVVFRDFNGNGVQNTNPPSLVEPGVQGVIINAFNSSNQIVASYQSDSNGQYSIPAGSSAYNGIIGSNTGSVAQNTPVRIEFVIPQAIADNCGLEAGQDFSGFSASVYGSSVQFANGGANNIHFAIQTPGEFRNSGTPTVFIPCYVNGDPLGGGSSGDAEWFVAFPYTNANLDMPSAKINGKVLGTVHGVAFSRQAQKVFTSAFVKRHSGLGVLGTGGIYTINYNGNGQTGAVSTFYNLDANGYPTRYNGSKGALPYGNGSSFLASNGPMNSETVTYLGPVDDLTGMPAGLGVVGSNSMRGLSPDKSIESHDPAAFDQVGKVGLGDLAISDDGRYLYVTNLYTRKVMRLELNNPYNPTAVVAVTEYSIPEFNCNNGVLRPFGLKFNKGKLYVGTICSGENGGVNTINGATDLYAQVFELNQAKSASPTWTSDPLINIPLNYRKGSSYTLGGCGGSSRWKPWTNTFQTTCNLINFRLVWEQPILSDIEFADDGAMVLGFMDRMGHMAGGGNVDLVADPVEDFLYYTSTGGDMLKVFVDADDNCSLRIETSADRTASQNNNQGPGGGEFFNTEFFSNHHETAQGTLLRLPGTGEIMSTVMDPFAINSGGLKWLNTSTGATNRNLQLYAGVGAVGFLGKANGLGAMDFDMESPPLEIGNRIWLDDNKNGIQDANEAGIDGIIVELYQANVKVGETTTANGGHYYFTNSNVNLNGANGVLPLTTYEIRVNTLQNQLLPLELTQQLVDSGPNSRVRDSDAALVNDRAIITYTTGNAGENDHTLDIGFFQRDVCPELPAAPGNVIIVDSDCNDCILNEGSISQPSLGCPDGSIIQYSINSGASWTSTLPVYDPSSSVTVITRCQCTIDENIFSPNSAPVSTNPANCPISCECPLLTTPPSNVIITDASCINCISTPGLIESPVSGCPAGSVLQYSTDNGNTWTTQVPLYDNNQPITIITRCLCGADVTVFSPVSDPITTAPQNCPVSCDCPDLTNGPGQVLIVDQNCMNCVLQPGSIIIDPGICPAGSTPQYSTDGGNNWTSQAPEYNPNTPISFIIRCDCDLASNFTSPISIIYTTNPNTCPMSCMCPEFEQSSPVVITNSACVNCLIEGGTIGAPLNPCPSGSIIQYSVNGGAWSTQLPFYDLEVSISIRTRCICEADPSMTSPISIPVVTDPGSCPNQCECPDVSTPAPGIVVVERTCNNCEQIDGFFSAPSFACPPGSQIQYSIDNGDTWNTSLPIYDQTTSMTVLTRCQCMEFPEVVGPASVPVTTQPENCPSSCNTPACLIEVISTSVSVCDPFSNTFDLSVQINYISNQNDILIINGQSFAIEAGINVQRTFVLNGLVSTGNEIELSIGFSEQSGCEVSNAASFQAPDPCEPSCPEDYSIGESDISVNALALYSIPVCEDELVVVVQVSINLPCDGFFDPQLLQANFGGLSFQIISVGIDFVEYAITLESGNYSWSFTYTNPNGEEVTVTNNVEVDLEPNMPAVITMPGAISFTISYCAESPLPFELSIVDDCEDPINPENATFELCGDPIIPSGFDPNTGTFTFSIEVKPELHNCNFIATYVDGHGNITTQSLVLLVNGTSDEFAPIIVYPSEDITLSIGDCEEDITYCFYVSAYDDCDGDIIPTVFMNGVQIFPTPGTNRYCLTFFNEGNYDIFITASDSNGNTREENFTIVVNEGTTTTVSLACIDQLNVSLGVDCSVLVTAEMLLSGSFGCLSNSDFTITISDNGVILPNPIDRCGLFMYEVRLNLGVESSFDVCWGNLLVEDKLPPTINCLDASIPCVQLASLLQYSGTGFLTFMNTFNLPLPIVRDNCGILDTTFTIGDLVTLNGGLPEVCRERFVPVTITVRDLCGNVSSCTMMVQVLPDELATICGSLRNYDDLDLDAIPCNDPRLSNPNFLDSNGNPLPSWTGRPDIDLCNIHCSYSDINIPLCGIASIGSFAGSTPRKIVRTWTCLDWCAPNGSNIQECIQIIKVKDMFAPVLVAQDPALKSMNNGDCSYAMIFTAPIVTESCSGITAIELSINGGSFLPFVNGFYPSQSINPPAARRINVPVGTLNVIYRAVDGCGNSSTASVTYELEDKTPPIAICETFRVASLGSDCKVRIYADAFDDGSYDNCTEVTFDVRRVSILNQDGTPSLTAMPGTECYDGSTRNARWNNYNTYRDWVEFCCNDLTSDAMTRMVELRVRDAFGNLNSCMVTVDVQDKLPPTGVRPADLTIDCNDISMHWDWNNLTDEQRSVANTVFGTVVLEHPHEVSSTRRPILTAVNNPRIDEVQSGVAFFDGIAWDNCGGTQCFSMSQSEVFERLECNSGIITRTWTITDGGNNTLKLNQFITVVNFYPFNGGPNRRSYNSSGYYTSFRQGTNASIDPRDWSLFSPLTGNAGFQNGQSEAGAFRSLFRQAAPGESPTSISARAVNGYPTRFDVVWPSDLMIDVCTQGLHPDALAENPQWRSGSRPYIWREDICAQVGMTYDEWNFDFEAGCKKVIRQWKVIDWCQPESVIQPWTWVQTIKVVDTDGPDFTGIVATIRQGETQTLTCGDVVTFEFLDLCATPELKPINLVARGVDFCGLANDIDNIRWDWEVYPFGDRTSSVKRSSFPGQNFIPRGSQIEVQQSFPRTLPGGPAHIIKFIAEDGCGNKSVCEVSFRIEDRKKPTPICFANLSTDVMPAGSMEGSVSIQATLFNNNSNDNCLVSNYRIGQFVTPGLDTYTSGPRHLRIPLHTYPELIFTCKCPDVLPQGIADCESLREPNISNIRLVSPGETIMVAMWVGDNYGNWDYCLANIRVDNNMGANCDEIPMGFVSGSIRSALDQGIEFVELMNNWTDDSGNFMIELPAHLDYQLTPSRKDNPRNGVNVADIIFIQRHILGESRLDSPHKLIAADVDNSRSINAYDLVEIRKVLLGVIPEFSVAPSWKFIPANFEFLNPEAAHTYEIPDFSTVQVTDGGMVISDFIGIKTGDVNYSAQPNSQTLVPITSRNTPLSLLIDNKYVRAGEVIDIVLEVEEGLQLEGLQMTFNFDRDYLQFNGVESGNLLASKDNVGRNFLNKGWLPIVLDRDNQSDDMSNSTQLFSLRFNVLADANLSDLISIGSQWIDAIGVTNNYDIQPLQLLFRNEVPTLLPFELYQNRPNPFGAETLISFALPIDMKATLKFFDITGRVIKVIEGEYYEGLNNVIIKKQDLPLQGVIYYQLEAGEFKATKKMILVD